MEPLAPYLSPPWYQRLRVMRRTDPIYKPALLLAALQLIEEGLATPDHVPLEICARRFDELLAQTGLPGLRSGRAFMPIYHLSTSSPTKVPFWRLLQTGQPCDKFENAKTLSGFLSRADAASFLEEVSTPLLDPSGRESVRWTICDFLERDGRPDCLALAALFDFERPEVHRLAECLANPVAGEFHLDDPDPQRILSSRTQLVRDRSLRTAVLSLYQYGCALCGLRLRWRDLIEAEAAHIKPRSEGGADDARNALCLCRTHHWAFDCGLWTAEEDLAIHVHNTPDPGIYDLTALTRFEGDRLTPPTLSEARPHPEALAWHRTEVYGRLE